MIYRRMYVCLKGQPTMKNDPLQLSLSPLGEAAAALVLKKFVGWLLRDIDVVSLLCSESKVTSLFC